VEEIKHPELINRKEFLRKATSVISALAFSGVIQACSDPTTATATQTEDQRNVKITEPMETVITAHTEPAQPKDTATLESTETPTQVVEEGRESVKIALVRTDDRTSGVRKAIELLGINSLTGKSIFLKPNFNSSDAPPGSTHPDVLRTLVTWLKEVGAGEITVGDRSGMGNTETVMRELGIFELGKELGFRTIVFDQLRSSEWVKIFELAHHWNDGFLFAKPCLDCEAIVQTCCLKTHQYGGVFTMSLKNSVGMVAKQDRISGYNYMQELHTSNHQRKMIAEINTAYNPDLIVLDGVEAFVTGGPAKGQKAKPEVILAGTDRVAIDAVGVAVLRMHGATFKGGIFEQDQISHAIELGLGVDGPERIEFVTGDEASRDYVEMVQAEFATD